MRRLSVVICHGPYLERQLIDIGVPPDNLIQFNLSYKYLIDSSINNEAVLDLTEGGAKTCILFVGRVDRNKGVFDLLEAVSEILLNSDSLKLVYVGDGPCFEELKTKVAGDQIESKIAFMGYTDHRLIPQIIRQCRVLVSPSRNGLPEGRCKVAIEALVLGKPVIAPNTLQFQYIIKHNSNGLLFEPESISDLRAKIEAIIFDDKLYEELVLGAEEKGGDLLESSVSFRQALDHSFLSTIHKC
jgi:glycosyltransferase involved in cell wall biosynthesis